MHLAIENFAGIPMRLVREERRRGHESRLITLLSPMQKYEEDIALRLPALNLPYIKQLRRLVRGSATPELLNKRHSGTVKIWKPAHFLDATLFRLRDALWMPHITKALEELGGLEAFDIIFADGGHDFTRFPKILAKTSVPIITTYYGSDMRTRGLITGVQDKAQHTFTFEHDHTLIFPQAEFLLYPYEAPEYAPLTAYRPPANNEAIRVGHAPTNRAGKGTGEILAALERLKAEFPLEIVLIEGLPHHEALQLKATCHCFIDQIGELGYGVNSIESLIMGVPTAVELMPDFEQFLEQYCGEKHPFYLCRKATLEEDLRAMLRDSSVWEMRGNQGKAWAEKHHSVRSVADVILQRATEIVRANVD
ncbi:MAG: hypothetical protein MUF71_19995 [Candidatus Kapabacteria bacterium]|nr:hypothetical protein [Candidatus Kapabacteria bacterium]